MSGLLPASVSSTETQGNPSSLSSPSLKGRGPSEWLRKSIHYKCFALLEDKLLTKREVTERGSPFSAALIGISDWGRMSGLSASVTDAGPGTPASASILPARLGAQTCVSRVSELSVSLPVTRTVWAMGAHLFSRN